MSISQITDKALPQKVSEVLNIILEENPMHKKFLTNALAYATMAELEMMDKYLTFCSKKDLDAAYMANSYLMYVGDTIKEQIYFLKNKNYRYKTYAEVASHVYDDKNYMDQYMYGLAITTFLWPNHLDMVRLFSDTIPKRKSGKYLEVGPGHGYYLMQAMELGIYDEFLGIDISASSIQQTKDIIDYFKPDYKDKYSLQLIDFLEAKDLKSNSYDAIIIGEVLEHVERPEDFLKRVVDLAKDDAYIFVTTVVNAPAIDHIFLWRNKEDLETLIKSSGLKIKKALYLPYEGKTLAESEAQELSINMAYILEKA